MQTIEEMWTEYKGDVVPEAAGTVQVQETKQAFFAGAAAIMHLFSQLANDPGVDSSTGGAAVEGVIAEMTAFVETLPGD